MATSRDLVYKTIEFDNPDRIPRQLWALPWAKKHYPEELMQIQNAFPDDITKVPDGLKEPVRTMGDPYRIGIYIDEWGCEFENKQQGIIGEVKRPMLENITDVDCVRPPRQCLEIDSEIINNFCANSEKFVLASCCPRPFERLQFLRGTENLMMDFIANPNDLKKIIKVIHDFYTEELEIWAKTDVDGLMFMDDWGSQQSLLISPKMWRDIFKPLYADYIRIAHDNGKKAFMHSDGYIVDIYNDLIDINLDAINSQIFCLGLDNLIKFKGRITFWGELDRQHLLPNGTEDDIEKAVREIYFALYSEGGVIAQMEFGPGAKPSNVKKAFEIWNKMALFGINK